MKNEEIQSKVWKEIIEGDKVLPIKGDIKVIKSDFIKYKLKDIIEILCGDIQIIFSDSYEILYSGMAVVKSEIFPNGIPEEYLDYEVSGITTHPSTSNLIIYLKK